jgi:23S rRNA pseudouridine2605 synthase
MSLTEGKNREIKRVMAHLGLDVTRLIRVSYGPFQLGDLAEGAVEEVRLKTLREQLGKSLAEFAGADFAAPLREKAPAEQQEARQRAEKRSRKHVSTLRKERDEGRDVGPRARVTRGAVADRKGRAVAVERVTPVRRKTQEENLSRNARRFESMRGERPPRRERFARDETRRDERQPTQARRSPPRWEESRGERQTRQRQTTQREEAPRHEQRFEQRSDRDKPRDRHGAAHFESASPRRDRDAGRDAARFERTRPRRDSEAATEHRRGGAERQGRAPKFDKTGGKRKFSTLDKSSGPQASRGEDGARSPRKGDASTGPRKTPRTGPVRGGAGAPRKGARKGPRKPRGA